MKLRNLRAIAAVIAAVGLVALAHPSFAAPAQKVTICHKTDSPTNPYVEITVSQNALADHAGHGDVIPAPPTGCSTDLCPNIDGLQLVVPPGLVIDANGNCVPPDVCPNISGDQATVPPGFVIDANGNCVPPAQPCNSSTKSGGAGTTVTLHELGQAGPLSFQFTYQAYSIPDAFTIRYEGNVVYTTGGPVSGGATVTVNLPAGTSTQVEVTVIGSSSGTLWDYIVNCPTP